ncbi:MAG: trypsin-like peptidase domain-containing protein [Thermoproteota archaeon]|nr:trypsin-like peptidase domain-containing protein [Thermoproteota archaeon]
MTKSVPIVSGLIGAFVIVLFFTFIVIPNQEVSTPDLIASNGHDATKLGDESTLSVEKNLSLVELFEKSEKGVVRIDVDKTDSMGERNSVGSGFIFDYFGNIITNTHVIDNASNITVTFLDGSQYNASIVGMDKFTDIAVIKVLEEKPDYLHPLQIGDSSTLKVGESVAAIGNPFGLSGSMTSGIVSQIGRLLPSHDTGFSIPNVIQTDAAINPGNSGGPLLNMNGEVMGINTAIQSGTGQSAGIGFAVPSNTISKVVPVLITEGKYSHPWIGISGQDINPDLAKIRNLDHSKGFLIVTVIPDSPAEMAGLKGVSEIEKIGNKEYPKDGDIIVSVDGKEVRKISDILIHLQEEKSVGDEMILGIIRDGEQMDIILTLVVRPDL